MGAPMKALPKYHPEEGLLIFGGGICRNPNFGVRPLARGIARHFGDGAKH